MNNKRAQIGKMLTWMIATALIFLILFLSILAVSLFQKSKGYIQVSSKNTADLLATKSLTAYLLTPEPEEIEKNIYNRINEEEKLKDDDKRLFESLYRKNYGTQTWLRILERLPQGQTGVSEEIKLKNNKILLLTLTYSQEEELR